MREILQRQFNFAAQPPDASTSADHGDEPRVCFVCKGDADSYLTRGDGSVACNAGVRHWYCQRCITDHVWRVGNACALCGSVFSQVETVGRGPWPVPSRCGGARCIVCKSPYSGEGNELLLCQCASCRGRDVVSVKAVHVGCTHTSCEPVKPGFDGRLFYACVDNPDESCELPSDFDYDVDYVFQYESDGY